MKWCKDCKYAKWERTKNGSLHPNGEGRCSYQYTVPPLPASMYWINTPIPAGGMINRKKELKTHCPYWQRKEK